jgi:hypothetical protein
MEDSENGGKGEIEERNRTVVYLPREKVERDFEFLVVINTSTSKTPRQQLLAAYVFGRRGDGLHDNEEDGDAADDAVRGASCLNMNPIRMALPAAVGAHARDSAAHVAWPSWLGHTTAATISHPWRDVTAPRGARRPLQRRTQVFDRVWKQRTETPHYPISVRVNHPFVFFSPPHPDSPTRRLSAPAPYPRT